MKRSSTFLLRAAVVLVAIGVLGFLFIVTPDEISISGTGPMLAFVLALYLSALPFFFALYQVLKLLNYVDQNKAFSAASVKALKHIKYSAIVFALLYTAILPLLFWVAQADDAPGLGAIGLMLVFGPAIAAIFAAVLQKLVQNGIDLKSENDLTV